MSGWGDEEWQQAEPSERALRLASQRTEQEVRRDYDVMLLLGVGFIALGVVLIAALVVIW